MGFERPRRPRMSPRSDMVGIEMTFVGAGRFEPTPSMPPLTFARGTTYCASIAITPSGSTWPPSTTIVCPVM
jgi:hypothetical protein